MCNKAPVAPHLRCHCCVSICFRLGTRSNDYVPPVDDSGAVPGVPGLQSTVPRGWFPDFARAPGTPLSKATFDGKFTFSREWTGVSVTINVKEETVKLAWKKKRKIYL